jgi:hypothetical protein
VRNTKSKAIQLYFNEIDFDENAITTMIYYIDCNQLYPTSMLYNLPIGGYKFIPTERKNLKWLSEIDEKENDNYSASDHPTEDMAPRAQGDIG